MMSQKASMPVIGSNINPSAADAAKSSGFVSEFEVIARKFPAATGLCMFGAVLIGAASVRPYIVCRMQYVPLYINYYIKMSSHWLGGLYLIRLVNYNYIN